VRVQPRGLGGVLLGAGVAGLLIAVSDEQAESDTDDGGHSDPSG
jgi:hypothetical protein